MWALQESRAVLVRVEQGPLAGSLGAGPWAPCTLRTGPTDLTNPSLGPVGGSRDREFGVSPLDS